MLVVSNLCPLYLLSSGKTTKAEAQAVIQFLCNDLKADLVAVRIARSHPYDEPQEKFCLEWWSCGQKRPRRMALFDPKSTTR